MMILKRSVMVLAAAACVAGVPARSAAQTFGPSVEAGVGMFTGGGSGFTNRGGPALDGVLAVPIARTGAGTLVAGVTAGIHGPMAYDLFCEAAPNGDCKPDFPTLFGVGAVAGIQRQMSAGISARALAGPVYYQSVDGPNVLGLQGRFDVAKPLIYHTALVATVRGAVIPSYQGETLSFAAFGLGLRIQ